MRAGPAERPTEWTAAVAGLATAAILFSMNKDVGALAVAVTSFLPAIITAVVVYVRSGAWRTKP